jgi:hypothetical protein
MRIALITTLVWLASAAGLRAGAVATFGLASAGQDQSVALLDVTLSFTGGPADTIDLFQIGVTGSSAGLSASGTDYSRFRFLLDTVTLPDFSELVGVDQSGVGLYLADPLGSPISTSATPIHLGVLRVDLAGLASGDYTVRLDGPAGLGSDASGIVGGVAIDSFAAAPPDVASVAYAPDSGVILHVRSVPEPSAFLLSGIGLATLALRRRRAEC